MRVGGDGADGAGAAVDLAKLIASKSPIAVMGTKHLMNRESGSGGEAEAKMRGNIREPCGVQSDSVESMRGWNIRLSGICKSRKRCRLELRSDLQVDAASFCEITQPFELKSRIPRSQ